jgi:SAM-dependent methyltransferase
VIFSDISQHILDYCAALVRALGRADQCTFVRASASDLAPMADASVDVVTTRSVLIYVAAKQVACNEFYRVLRPGGRLSLFEPINRFAFPEPPGRFMGYDVSPVQVLADKVSAVFQRQEQSAMEAMMDFGERDLLRYAERAGFPEVQMDAHFQVIKYPASLPLALESRSDASRDATPQTVLAAPLDLPWESWLRSAPNPLAPTLEEAITEALTPEEAIRFTAHLRPLYEAHQTEDRAELVYLWAVKHRGAGST